VRRLTDRDPATLAHFCAYFQKILTLKLRGRRIEPNLADDVRQETFARILKILWEGPGVKQPERLGALVAAICNNVLRERRFQPVTGVSEQLPDELPDNTEDRLASLITEENKRRVAAILDETITVGVSGHWGGGCKYSALLRLCRSRPEPPDASRRRWRFGAREK
jgi:DNA-directed RNA polymerase specialized sigma24 family protein